MAAKKAVLEKMWCLRVSPTLWCATRAGIKPWQDRPTRTACGEQVPVGTEAEIRKPNCFGCCGSVSRRSLRLKRMFA